MKKFVPALAGGLLLLTTLHAHAAPASHPAPGSDAETAELNARSLQDARASLKSRQATGQQAAPQQGKQPVQAAGTGETSGPVQVPMTGSTVSGY
ncbi:hypothetical protein DY926_05940 [Komagataeibacter melaceti]|uniref:DUF4148 domain-containing protein n=1 Tax=Komagataeibacter melaceti TaxID=2766577 RepID=A0A371Z1P1_9PROT|nr:hypothetical protein [Komagataeibacter melaceti]RFD20401.1 hypothetical protein DY926_05940 [Komagataeibacter melaceti]